MHVSYRYALLSDLAYQTTLAGVQANMPIAASGFGYETTILFQNSGFVTGGTSLSGFTAASSNFAVTVFKNGSQYVIAFRGSDSKTDILNSVGIGNGNYNDQVRDAIEFVHAFMAQVSTNVILTGHSLGGALAGISASYFGLEAYTIAPVREFAARPACADRALLAALAEPLMRRGPSGAVACAGAHDIQRNFLTIKLNSRQGGAREVCNHQFALRILAC